MEKINEIKLPKGVESISVTQHDDKIVIEFIPKGDEFKNGDFVYEDGRIMIVDEFYVKRIGYHALIYPQMDLEVVYNDNYASPIAVLSLNFRYATEEEKQLLIDALKKDGKRWNADKKCIEDIPQPKFKAGDKVKIKDGISSKTHRGIYPLFTEPMDEFIGKKLTVEKYNSMGFVITDADYFGYNFAENWLEPWSDEPKKCEEPKNGDLAIFWQEFKTLAVIKIYDRKDHDYHCDSSGIYWKNAIKFESKEQFEKVLRGKI